MKRMKKSTIILCIAALLVVSCNSINQASSGTQIEAYKPDQNVPEDTITTESFSEELDHPEGWSDETHGKDADPNYDVVFPQDSVNRIDIVIDAENWGSMLEDMTTNYGAMGTNGSGGQGGRQNRPEQGNQFPPNQGQRPEDGMRPDMGDMIENGEDNPFFQNQGQRPADGMNPGMGGMMGMMEDDDNNPIWVTATIQFEDNTWTNVGMRFKGNSSLKSSWQSGNLKLPFKLDFDEFEDTYPEIEDQRFYGFKQLSFSSNFKDDSYLHEKVAADVFREADVPAANTAYYEVYVDFGEGPTYFGLYTLVEVIDDTVIETQFEDDSGNVYKPSGSGATFSAGSFSESSFDKETNQDEADYSDILAMYEALHAETRTTDPQSWRAGLEAVFDVPGFLKYLAVNSVIGNWDTYGVMSHNYYLYHDPSTDLLTWIPWDNNEAMQSGSGRGTVSISLDEVSEEWPLIRYLLDDAAYHAAYVEYVEEFINSVYLPETLTARFEALHEMISPYVLEENAGYSTLSSETAFNNSVDTLAQYTISRYQEASNFISTYK